MANLLFWRGVSGRVVVAALTLLGASCSSSSVPADQRGTDGSGRADGAGEDLGGGGDGPVGNACLARGGVCGTPLCPAGYHDDDTTLPGDDACNPCPPGAPCARFACCLPDDVDGGLDGGVDAADARADGEPGDLGDAPLATDLGPVACGSMSCGADEIRVIQCTCCGIPTDMAPTADYRCEPIAPGCQGSADPCACSQVHCDFASSGSCTAADRTLSCPCA